MINNEIYTLRDISQQIAVIINIDNQNFLYKIEENAYIPISKNISNFFRNENINITLTGEELELVGNIKAWINKQGKDNFVGSVPNTYILKLIPTLRCNLNCSYCFANEKSSDFDMTVETSKTAIDFFLNHFQLSRNCTYVVDLTGAGEPLLRLDYILEVNKYVKEIENRKKIHIFCQLATNGMLLTPETSKIIQESGIIFGVSLDGDKNISVNRKGLDYELVEKNINAITYKDFFGLAATYDGNNNDIVAIFKTLNQFEPAVIGIKPVRLNSVIKNAINEENIDKVLLSYKSFAEYLFDELVKNNFSVWQRFINGEDYFARFLKIMLRKNRVKYRCAAGVNSFAVDSKGDILICPVFTGIKKYKLGSIFEGFNLERLNEIKALYADNIDKCKICWAKNACAGECFNVSYINSGNLNTPNESMCKLKKYLIQLSMYFWTALRINQPVLYKYCKDSIK